MRARFAWMVCLLACSSQNPADDGGTDANGDVTSDVTPQEAGKDSAPTGCNALTNVGTVISQAFVATDPVTGDGGAVVNGTYVLTAAAIYTGADGGSGPTGTTFLDTLAIQDGGTYERVASIVNDAGLDGSPLRQNGSYTLDASSFHATQTCPAGTQPFTSYDSNGTKVHIYAPAAGPNNPGLMFEYTKQ